MGHQSSTEAFEVIGYGQSPQRAQTFRLQRFGYIEDPTPMEPVRMDRVPVAIGLGFAQGHMNQFARRQRD